MSITEQDLANPLDVIREGLATALQAEEERYAAAVAALTEEHESVVDRMKAALAVLDGDVATNGHSEVDAGVVVEPSGPPPVEPGDVEVNVKSATVSEIIQAVMATRRGEVWTAQQMLAKMRELGYTGGRDDASALGTIRATMSQLYHKQILNRPEPGDYILP